MGAANRSNLAFDLISPVEKPDAEMPSRRARVLSLRPGSSALQLVANANASGLRRRPELIGLAQRFLESFHGHRIDVRMTESLDELEQIALEEERRLVLLGGDGTLHALANLPGRKPELALLPIGGANNVARSLQVPTDLRAAAELAVRGRARPIDAIAVSAGPHRYVAIEGVSAGYHALARASYRAVNSTDAAAGIAAAATALLRFHPFRLALEADGETEVGTVSQLFVANTPLFGPKLLVAPMADPADGYLDLVRISPRSRASLLATLVRLRAGADVRSHGVSFRRVRRIRVATGGSSPVIADTVDLGHGPVELAVEPAALRVVSPER